MDNKNSNNHVNLHFKNKNGNELAQGNKVLYINLHAGTDKVFSPPTHSAAISKDETQLFNSQKKKESLSNTNYWTLQPGFPSFRTKDDNNLAKKYTEYDAFMQFKTQPPQNPKEFPITTTANYSSSIAFENLSRHVDDGYNPTAEVNNIFALVKGSGVSDYFITIKGNIYSGGSFKEGGGMTGLNLFTKYSNYGELALARANTIKKLLVAKGLDPSKIKTELGDPNKGMTADYKITTTALK